MWFSTPLVFSSLETLWSRLVPLQYKCFTELQKLPLQSEWGSGHSCKVSWEKAQIQFLWMSSCGRRICVSQWVALQSVQFAPAVPFVVKSIQKTTKLIQILLIFSDFSSVFLLNTAGQTRLHCASFLLVLKKGWSGVCEVVGSNWTPWCSFVRGGKF